MLDWWNSWLVQVFLVSIITNIIAALLIWGGKRLWDQVEPWREANRAKRMAQDAQWKRTMLVLLQSDAARTAWFARMSAASNALVVLFCAAVTISMTVLVFLGQQYQDKPLPMYGQIVAGGLLASFPVMAGAAFMIHFDRLARASRTVYGLARAELQADAALDLPITDRPATLTDPAG